MDPKTGRTLVALDPRYLRPTEVETLLGDAAKARRELVREMAQADLHVAKAEALAKSAGYARPRRVAD